jgi:ABC-type bacteriocin/lantibiotic exporter with double-glycine peptidase domain
MLAALLGTNWWLRGHWAGPPSEPDVKPEPVVLPVAIPGPRSEDPGLQCLYLICRLASIDVDLTDVRELMEPSSSGTSILTLKNAASKLGFSASAKHITWTDLLTHLADEASFAILFCGTNHFVAAISVASDKIVVIDPTSAIQEIDESTSSSDLRWSGKVLLLRRSEIPGVDQ